MQPITGKIKSFHADNVFIRKPSSTSKKWRKGETTVSQIREDEGFEVSTYRKLLDEVAFVTINNRNYDIFFRGQGTDHKDKNGKSKIYPSIYRPPRTKDGRPGTSIRMQEIDRRYNQLYALINESKGNADLMAKYKNDPLTYFDEFHISQFQHYEIVQTPFIDITQSLRVAASFALRKSSTGYLYVFGLPYPNGSISHYIDQNIVLVKLQNVSPVDAYRPRYQEGYLVGKYPIKREKEAGDNLARRMIAKFKLVNHNGKFWEPDFTRIGDEVLFPEPDAHKAVLNDLKRNMNINDIL